MAALALLIADDLAGGALPRPLRERLNATRDADRAADADRMFVLASATALPRVAESVSRASHLHRLGGLLVLNDLGREWVNQIFNRAGLRRITQSVVHRDPEVFARILNAAALGAQRSTIADATVAGDTLFVLGCDFRLHEMPFGAYPALAAIPAEGRARFEVHLDGAFLHWPEHDVDLDLESVVLATDPDRRRAAELARTVEDAAFGRAVRSLRTSRGVRQSGVAGLSERQVRRIEAGESTATVDAIDRLAAAHGMDADAYLAAVAERMDRA
jgi:hypothetical protein